MTKLDNCKILYHSIKRYVDSGTANFKKFSCTKFLVYTLKMSLDVKKLFMQNFDIIIRRAGLTLIAKKITPR